MHATGTACVARGLKELEARYSDGDIVVLDRLSNEMIPVLKTASGIITEGSDHLDDLKILAMALDIPVITGAAGATKILKTGTSITLDASNGMVYAGHKSAEFN